MTIPEILSKLDRVRRSGRGWTARCPSHNPDKTPSLSIREGDRGILVRCWAGCSLDEICTALGIRPRDLFFDERPDPARIRKAQHRREKRDAVRKAEMIRPEVYREAEGIARAVTIRDVSTLSEKELDEMMDIVGDAWNLLIEERNAAWTRKSDAA